MLSSINYLEALMKDNQARLNESIKKSRNSPQKGVLDMMIEFSESRTNSPTKSI